MSLIETIPEELRNKESQEEFLLWLQYLPAPVHIKKYLLLDWCEFTGVPMRHSFALAVGIPLQI